MKSAQISAREKLLFCQFRCMKKKRKLKSKILTGNTYLFWEFVAGLCLHSQMNRPTKQIDSQKRSNKHDTDDDDDGNHCHDFNLVTEMYLAIVSFHHITIDVYCDFQQCDKL